jgi:hypothetical protein
MAGGEDDKIGLLDLGNINGEKGNLEWPKKYPKKEKNG